MQDEVVIRNDRIRLIVCVVLLTIPVVVNIGMLIADWGSSSLSDILFQLFWGTLFLAPLIYFTKELYVRKVEMAISREGIYLRNLGLYPWSLIKSFSTVEDTSSDSTTEKLVLHFENYADEDFVIGNLEYEKEEIIDLMLAYKGSSEVYYAGHKTK